MAISNQIIISGFESSISILIGDLSTSLSPRPFTSPSPTNALPPPHPLHASQPLYFPFVKLLTLSYPRPPASLYITQTSQNLSLGSLCLTILENLAIEEYGAEWLTLDTTPYVIEPGEGGILQERVGMESRNLGWYRRRGYEEFRVSLTRNEGFGFALV